MYVLACVTLQLLQIDTGSSLEQLNNDEAFSGTGEVWVRNCIIGVYSMQLQSQIGSSGGVICSVDAYMYQLQLYNVITTCDDSLHCKNLRVVLTLQWVILSCMFRGFYNSQCIVSAAIWTGPQNFLLFYQNG